MMRFASILIAIVLTACPALAGPMSLLGAGKVSGGGGPVTIFTPTLPLNANDTNTNASFRMKYLLSASSLGSIRATFVASTAGGLTVAHMSFCKWDGSGDVGSCTTTPIELTSSCPGNTSGSGFALAAGGTCTTNFVSHVGTFTLSSGDSIVVVFDVTTPGNQRDTASGVTNSTLGFLPGGATWNQQSPAGFGPGSAGVNYVVSSVESQ